jgi:uncharacterized membrane protein
MLFYFFAAAEALLMASGLWLFIFAPKDGLRYPRGLFLCFLSFFVGEMIDLADQRWIGTVIALFGMIVMGSGVWTSKAVRTWRADRKTPAKSA